MLLPFQRKTFATSLTVEDAKMAVRAIINERVQFLIFSANKYQGSMDGKTFSVRKGAGYGMTTSIKGVIRAENPTIVELRSSPPYVFIAFLSSFAVIWIYIAFSSDQVTINGVKKVMDLSDQIYFALMGTLAPAVMFLTSTIVMVQGLERRLKEVLMLNEVRTS